MLEQPDPYELRDTAGNAVDKQQALQIIAEHHIDPTKDYQRAIKPR